MSNQLHMVVMPTPFGAVVLTKTDDSKEPAVYVDAAAAETRCAALRARFGEGSVFAVVDFYPG